MDEVKRRRIKEMEEAKIICGYHTLINWEKTDNVNVSAIIELKVNPQKGKGRPYCGKNLSFPSRSRLLNVRRI